MTALPLAQLILGCSRDTGALGVRVRSSATVVEIVFYWPGDQRSLARRVPPPSPLEAGHGDSDLGTVRLSRRQGRARRPPQGPVQGPRLRGGLVVAPPPDG